MKNSNQRMRELYQEAIDGHKHERKTHGNGNGVGWYPHHNSDDFYSGTQYRIKKDNIEEAAKVHANAWAQMKENCSLVETSRTENDFKAGARFYKDKICKCHRDNNND